MSKKLVIFCIFSCIALFSLWFTNSSVFLDISDKKHITIADASQPVFALLYIADKKGYFSQEGLEVSFKTFASGRDALENVLAGESDIATVFETPVVKKTFEGEKLSVISTLHTSTRNTGIVARQDRGIEKPTDLKGKTIGVTKNTSGEFLLFQYLAQQGIELSDVNLIEIEPENMVTTFQEGKLDAIATWNPHLNGAQNTLSKEKIITFYSDVYTEISLLTGKRQFTLNNPEILTSLLKGIIKAEHFLRNNNAEALDIVVQRLSKYPESLIRKSWNTYIPEATLSNVSLLILQQEALWLKNNGYYQPTIPDFNKVIYTDYLKAVRPEAVTIR